MKNEWTKKWMTSAVIMATKFLEAVFEHVLQLDQNKENRPTAVPVHLNIGPLLLSHSFLPLQSSFSNLWDCSLPKSFTDAANSKQRNSILRRWITHTSGISFHINSCVHIWLILYLASLSLSLISGILGGTLQEAERETKQRGQTNAENSDTQKRSDGEI